MPVKKIAISVKHLSVVQNGDTLIDDFSFDIPSGAFVAVLGPNGSGKTTLMRVILGLVEATSGTIAIFGDDASRASSRRRIGYIPQRGGSLDADFPATAYEVVCAGRTQKLGLFRRFGRADRKAVLDAFALLAIEHLRDRTIGALSGGELQRVLLARALSTDPDILILDEPVDGLDVASRESFHAALAALKKHGKTILFVTHEAHSVEGEADAAICLRHELICHGGKDACLVKGRALANLYHEDMRELAEHNG